MPIVIKFFKSFEPKVEGEEPLISNEVVHGNEEEEESKLFEFSHPNFKKSDGNHHKEKDIKKLENRFSYWISNYWLEFDNVYMKKRLVHDWPNCKTQNDELSEKITDLAEDYNEEFKKRDHEKENSNDNIEMNDFEMKQFSQGNKDALEFAHKNNMHVAFNEKNFENSTPSPNNLSRKGEPKSQRNSNFSNNKIKDLSNLKIDL